MKKFNVLKTDCAFQGKGPKILDMTHFDPRIFFRICLAGHLEWLPSRAVQSRPEMLKTLQEK